LFSLVATCAATLVLVAFTPANDAMAGPLQSDDFHSTTLDTLLWDTVNPLGDATFLTTGTNLWIRVPGHSTHTLWNTCTCAPQLVQPISDTDFEMEAKFDSAPTERYQIQGFVVRQDADTYIRFDVHHDGTNPVIYAVYINGVNPPSMKISQVLTSVPPYLRVTRSGDNWTFSYSDSGTTWTNAGTFSRTLTVADAGLFAGNENEVEYNTPAFVANVDYFFNTASPITPEDGGDSTVSYPPVVEVWYGDAQDAGHLGVPQTWFDVLGSVWGPNGVSSLSYALNGGASNPLTVGPDGARLVGYGDYNIEIACDDLVAGSNEVVISVQDTLGQVRDTTVTIDYTDGVVWSLPDTTDWGAATRIADEAQVVDGRWRLVNDGVRLDSLSAGLERALVVGDRTWTSDYEVTLPFTVNVGDVGGYGRVGVLIGWQGHTGLDQPRRGGDYQTIAWINNFTTSPALRLVRNGGAVAGEVAVTAQVGQHYFLKMQSQSLGAGQSRVRAKFWHDGDPEPGSWAVEDVFTRRDGSILLIADRMDATFGDVVVTPTATLGHLLTTTTTGSGSINRSPNYSLYPDSAVVQLSAVPDPGWTFQGWGDGLSGSQTPVNVTMVSDTTVSATFVPAIQSDDFHYSDLNTTLWRIVDPLGDATVQMTGTNLLINLEGGASHDLWNTCNCGARLLQPSYDTDFELEVKFDSHGYLSNQAQGIVVQADDSTYLRFDVVYSSTGYFLFSGYVDADSAETKISTSASTHPHFLRVKRTGDTWTFRYSSDGSTWITAGSFGQTLAVTEVGLSVTNDNLDPYQSPAYICNVDYFFNRAYPISPEDGGEPSAPTPPVVSVWYGDVQHFGDLGVPQQWAGVLGSVSDPDHIASLSYALNGGPSNPLNIGPDGLRLASVGEFIVEIDFANLVPGANDLVITAVDSIGEQTDKTVTIDYTDGITWQMPYTVDWSSVTEITDAAQVVAGRWDLTGDGVRNASNATGYDRLIDIGDYRWLTDYEATVPVTIHGGNLGGTSAIGFVIGWQGHTGAGQPRTSTPFQTAGWLRNVPDNPRLELRDDEIVRAQTLVPVDIDSLYYLKVHSEVIGGGQVTVKVKLWADGSPEPGSWDLSQDFSERDGSVLLVSHYADVTFGNVTITPLSTFPQYTLDVQIVGNGSVSRSPDYSLYSDSSQVVLTALPDSGWVFDGWSGGLSGSENPDTLVMIADTSVTATFVPLPPTYVLTRNVVGSGTIDVSPDLASYDPGDTVIVTALPDSGWSFAGWSDGLTGTENPDTLVMQSDTTITATFTQPQYAINVTVVGNGSVLRNPDKALYDPGEEVALVAVPDSGWVFMGWSGDLTSFSNADTVTVTADVFVTATFGQALYTVSTSTEGSGYIIKNPNKTKYASGQVVAMTAVPNVGWSFAGWSAGLSGSQNPDTLTVTSDTLVTATFVAQQYSVDITIVGDGIVTRNPNRALYAPGEKVVLTAAGQNSMSFTGWSGDLTGTQNPDTVTVDSSMAITATFEPYTGVEDGPPSLTTLRVLTNTPNPFTHGTRFEYGLPEQADVDISVYDAAGRRVYSERIASVGAGWHTVYFEGRQSNGQPLPSGVYFYRVQALRSVVTRKMVIVR